MPKVAVAPVDGCEVGACRGGGDRSPGSGCGPAVLVMEVIDPATAGETPARRGGETVTDGADRHGGGW